ncbi:MFS transporter [Hydrogenibacillus sp. N12]|uniref:MFS transporter n=1 Tax=Hydrogenibacillus sp. N12 TaxID=2866627 RepID=UPI001C7DB881|nr:MFS transporter [Hydrogenibacillus sp. N12]QZA32898.1 MFS transporter [Hydrogenibacillus sp. N12]
MNGAKASSPPSRLSPAIATGVMTGTILEWYDLFLFAIGGAYVGKAFFPSDDPLAALLAVYVTYAIAFAIRPIGAILFGYIGDRRGRREALFWTLFLAGISTSLIGLIPSYARWGVWAPIAVVFLRLLMGLAVGGEWGAATSYIYDATKRKVVAQIVVQSGVPGGIILAAVVLLGIESLLGKGPMEAWGWRIAFLLSIVLVGIGLMFRIRFPEAFEYEAAKEAAKKEAGELPDPLKTVIVRHPLKTLAGILLTGAVGAGFIYSWTTLPATAMAKGVISTDAYIKIVLLYGVVELIGVILGGLLSEAFSNRTFVYVGLFGLTLTGLSAVIALSSPWFLVLAVALGGLSHGLVYTAQASYLTGLFPTLARTTGISFSYQMGNGLVTGTTPMITTSLVKAYGFAAGGIYVALLLVLAAAVVTSISKRPSTGA